MNTRCARTTVAIAVALLAAPACRDAGGARAATFELRAVVAPKIAQLEREAEGGKGADAPLAEPSADLVERVRGLILDLPQAHGKMRALQVEEAGSIGDDAVPVLAACLADGAVPDDQRLAAIELLGAIDTPRGAALLAAQVESAPKAWVRANAAWQLARSSQDQVVPRLLHRLKYEIDGETVIWTAAALAHFSNYAGLEGLRAVAAGGTTPELRASAAGQLDEIVRTAGFETAEALERAWNGSEIASTPKGAASPRHRLEIWRRIALLSEHDLRAVDDGRFVLARSAAWVVEPLCEALHELDVYVRLHAAQCLERMGPRASSAGPTLVEALAEPRLAPAAAAALGSIGYPQAAVALIGRLAAREDPEMRVAAARALGWIGEASAIAPLRALLAPSEPIDVRQAAAQSLAALGRGDEVAPFLVECLTAVGADAGAAETALERWLEESAQQGGSEARTARERWQALASPPGITPDPKALAERQAARAEILRGLLASAPH